VTINSVASIASLGAPSSRTAAATNGAESLSPRLEIASSVRGVSSRKSAVPSHSRRPSASTSSIFRRMRACSSCRGIKLVSVASCCCRSASTTAAASPAFPVCAFFAASISRFVTPLIAETTTTQLFSLAACAIICAVRAMHEASPTDVPPNFITCNLGFISSYPEFSRRSLRSTALLNQYIPFALVDVFAL